MVTPPLRGRGFDGKQSEHQNMKSSPTCLSRNHLARNASVLLLALGVGLGTSKGTAQTNAVAAPTPAQNPIVAALASFAVNTNSTFFNGERWELRAGAVVTAASAITTEGALGLSFYPRTNSNFSVEGDVITGATSGVVDAMQIGAGYNVVHYNLKFTAFADAGTRLRPTRPYGLLGLRAEFQAGANTFAFIQQGVLLNQQNPGSQQTVIGVGIRF
jgi:hypothetical protein